MERPLTLAVALWSAFVLVLPSLGCIAVLPLQGDSCRQQVLPSIG